MSKKTRSIALVFLTLGIIFISLNFFSVRGYAWEIDSTGTAYYIVDGDTLNVTSVGRIRLADIDTPESWESGYTAAKNYLSSLVYNKEVYVDEDNKTGRDQYGRMVAVIYVYYNDTHLKNVNKALLVTGHAVIDNYTNNDFDPYTWTLYVEYQSIPPPSPPSPPPPPPPPPSEKPDLMDRGSDYSGLNTNQVSPGSSHFNIYCDISNIGNASSNSFNVYFLASSDSTITIQDYLIGSDSVSSLDINSYNDVSWSGTFPSDIPDGTYFIGWIIDSLDHIDELDENNNKAFIASQQLLVDGTPPSSLISFTPKSGSNKIDKYTEFYLACSDGEGSGFSSIFYRIDSGTWIRFIDNFTLTNYYSGKHSISYYSIDTLNNIEEVRVMTINKIDLNLTEITTRFNILLVLIAGILVFAFSIVIYNRLNINLKKVLFKDKREREKKERILRDEIVYDTDPIINSIVSDLLNRYSDSIIAIYGIGSYFEVSLPQSWLKNDLDIIVFVKSLEEIPKQDWTEIRYEKKEVNGNHIWLGFNTLEAYRTKNRFSKESFSNYEWNLIDMKHNENSKLLYGENIQTQLPETDNLVFDYNDVLARGLYHLEKSLKQKDNSIGLKEFSKGIFKLGFYFCIYFDPKFRSTSIVEIGRKLQKLSANQKPIKKMVDFYENAIIFRLTDQYKTEFKELRTDLITYILSLFDQGVLHEKMNYKEIITYLTKKFSGFPNLIQAIKKTKSIQTLKIA